ncbi:hypothetical protein E1B28_012405 [Marasmius oreades]|uniref:Uncharacterized protein n=1 Tax=Marasmius oreades TaxID=181124 RepID=A0A9P7RSS0_9AGAR|nr:uncharacterized protein E1B28_012405 [Marasmius oreades]KAG7088408.1 hypothetical protein E1B28_012405 [Marasmius oreades]
MSATAKVHSHQSNRAKPAESQKKVVFKPVLDNPFRVYWPSVPVNLQNLILAQTSTLLDGIAEYQRLKGIIQRKRKRGKCDESGGNIETPPILSHLTVGINAVTKRLEGQLGRRKNLVKITSASDSITLQDDSLSSSTLASIRVVLVCRADVNPPILIDHIPHIVAAFNSSLPSHQEKEKPILLSPLPSGAEHTLAELLGLRRVAVLAFDDETPNLAVLLKDSEKIPVITAPWLVPLQPQQIIPTHIKQVRTTAPKDMKVAKEQRAAGRKAAKAKKKAKKTDVA